MDLQEGKQKRKQQEVSQAMIRAWSYCLLKTFSVEKSKRVIDIIEMYLCVHCADAIDKITSPPSVIIKLEQKIVQLS